VAFLLLMLQTMVLVAGCALVGQLLVGAFNWGGRQQNPVYRLFQLIASPVVKPLRWITPRFVLDQHIPIAAFAVLFFTYFWLGFTQRDLCRDDLAQAGCERWATAESSEGVKR
jgi:uncharacterized protein YggT (Ycf19 family)